MPVCPKILLVFMSEKRRVVLRFLLVLSIFAVVACSLNAILRVPVLAQKAPKLTLPVLEKRVVNLEKIWADRSNAPASTTAAGSSLDIRDSNFDGAVLNLIGNSSFEAEKNTVEPRQWRYQLMSTKDNTFRSPEGIHSGKYGLKFKGVSDAPELGISQPDTKITPGRTYTLSAWVKVVNAPRVTVKMGFWDEQNNTYGQMESFAYSGTKEWVRINMTAVNPGWITDLKSWFPMIEVRGLTNGAVYFDDVKLEEGSNLTLYNSAGLLGSGLIMVDSNGNLYPGESGFGSLGTPDNKWSHLFLRGDVNADGNGNFGGDVAVNGGDITSDGNLTINAEGYVRVGEDGEPETAKNNNDLYVQGKLETDGEAAIGGDLTVYGNVIPGNDDMYDLGQAGREWRDAYVDGFGYIDAISLLNDETITNETNGNVVFTGVGGADNTDIIFDLDGAYPVISSAVDTQVGLNDNLIFVGSRAIATTGNNNLTINAGGTGNLTIQDYTDLNNNLDVDIASVSAMTVGDGVSDTLRVDTVGDAAYLSGGHLILA